MRRILADHPNIKFLFGYSRLTAFVIIALVAVQVWVASFVASQTIWVCVLAAFVFGAFASHALCVAIHESAHDLIFKSRPHNKIAGLVCDFALLVPTSVSFRTYHLMHHQHLNDPLMDPDVVSPAEARLVGNSFLGKLLWLIFLPFSQALRPLKIPRPLAIDSWLLINIVLQIGVNTLLWQMVGPIGCLYLACSMLFGLGLHPLGGRWIQEHYQVSGPSQASYSYYGPLNWVMLNIGYHNEHHDFPMISWWRLPQIKATAFEYYDRIYSYPSYSRLLIRFLFDRRVSLQNRLLATAAVEKIGSSGSSNAQLTHPVRTS